jgi:hypothetical protein
MGPTVWELDGPIPILKRSKRLVRMERFARSSRTIHPLSPHDWGKTQLYDAVICHGTVCGKRQRQRKRLTLRSGQQLNFYRFAGFGDPAVSDPPIFGSVAAILQRYTDCIAAQRQKNSSKYKVRSNPNRQHVHDDELFMTQWEGLHVPLLKVFALITLVIRQNRSRSGKQYPQIRPRLPP